MHFVGTKLENVRHVRHTRVMLGPPAYTVSLAVVTWVGHARAPTGDAFARK